MIALRLGFLAFTLVWIGWLAQAQLSVVNVFAFLGALRTNFRWDYFLMAPLIFILWFAAAASLLFWNRGAYCGWLCPFGALQELTNRLARRLKVPQLKISFGVHQRLTALKYIIFLVLFGISLSDLGLAERMSEVEPFKTAIILRFAREWPFVLYAGAMVAASIFVERAFCRYLCPLGAALAIPVSPAHVRLAAALPRMRQSLPEMRQRMPRSGHPSRRAHQSERMHPVPALPDALPPRPEMPGDDPAASQARKARGVGQRRRIALRRFHPEPRFRRTPATDIAPSGRTGRRHARLNFVLQSSSQGGDA